MHIHFIGIGGAGIGPLAELAHDAGYKVSGSDLQETGYIQYLQSHGLNYIRIGEAEEIMLNVHKASPIDWIVYTAALTANNQKAPVLDKASNLGIKSSKRDEFINKILKDSNQTMLAIAGTHGKSTTTAMVIWLFKQLNLPASYIMPAKISFGEMAEYDTTAKYFINEADEYDRNFLNFNPVMTLISGVSWDHHEIYPTLEEYKTAFRQFISQSKSTIIWQSDFEYLGLKKDNLMVLSESDPRLDLIKLDGLYNRRDALLAATALSQLFNIDIKSVLKHINNFPGLSRRMEEIVPSLYSDYAHSPEKIRAAINVAKDKIGKSGKKLVVLYEPLTNRRQGYIKSEYKDCFDDADKVYWLDSYLAREDPDSPIITPKELIAELKNPKIAVSAHKDKDLAKSIKGHLDSGDMVIGLAGGGGGSLDDWLREQFGTLS